MKSQLNPNYACHYNLPNINPSCTYITPHPPLVSSQSGENHNHMQKGKTIMEAQALLALTLLSIYASGMHADSLSLSFAIICQLYIQVDSKILFYSSPTNCCIHIHVTYHRCTLSQIHIHKQLCIHSVTSLTAAGKPQLSSTGFELPWILVFIFLGCPDGRSGRFWGRTHCSKDPSGKFTCGGADCGSGEIPCNDAGAIPPASLMELTLASGTRSLTLYGRRLDFDNNIEIYVV
ncbi:Thaumatin-like protein 1a [Glycine max]|nr:Thaumatin-like protein 1a [Glycine max]